MCIRSAFPCVKCWDVEVEEGDCQCYFMSVTQSAIFETKVPIMLNIGFQVSLRDRQIVLSRALQL